MTSSRTPGFWLLIGIGLILNLLYLIGQTTALFNYSLTVALDLQEPASEITEVGVAFNKGFGLGDTIFYIPLYIAGIIGLLRNKQYGIYAMAGSLGITIYWPIVCLSALYFARDTPGFHFSDYTTYSVILPLISIYGLWGLWYLYARYRQQTQTD